MFGKKIGSVLYVSLHDLISYGGENMGGHKKTAIVFANSLQKSCACSFDSVPFRRFVFVYDIKTSKTRCVRLDSIENAHPFAEASFVMVGGSAYETKASGNLFHRMDLILHPSNPYWRFHAAVAAYEIGVGLLGNKSVPKGIGKASVWQKWVDQTVGLFRYAQAISDIRGAFM